ncbi:uncharacterized protein LOC129980583 [Argiope bruennichi]|uniref:uncharacterized protein LOC129980583 n=1 Tax=Argiope bruennichi TaxID=94029 RepID=UPI002494F6BF|nr:uncharacterized protein LOC129980583 [Argiope bruennichi]XP_055946936.1 uncharacterized protein LOC129980583 [Argiope bruennichi]
MGAAVAAYMASSQKRKNPETYLNELKGRIQENNKLFSVQNFLKLLENPNLYAEALILAKCYLEHLKFDVPLSVIWGFNFLNGNFEEAEEIFKIHPVSLNQVNSMICEKIRSTENFDLSKTYSEFLKKNCDDLKVKIKAYRCIFELLVNKNMYEEAIKLIEEFKEMEIPISNLPMSSLKIIHNFCVKNLEKNESVTKFALPLKETYHSSSDSDLE